LIGAAFLFSLMSVQVKFAGRMLPVEMLVLARGVVTLVMSFVWVRRLGLHPWGNNRRLLVLRGLLGLGGLFCFFYAITALPLAEVTVIHYLNPVFTTALAAVVLREVVDWRLALAILVSLGGTLLVTRPSFLMGADMVALPLAGSLAALGGALFSACAYVTVRRLTQTDHPHVIVFYFPLVAVPIIVPFAVRAWQWPTPLGWLLLLGIGVTTQLAQVLLTQGLVLVPAGRGTTIGYVQVLFAAVWGLLLFAETPGLWTAIGGALIATATLVLVRGRRSR
jgi:drug/metabolite transporter (DMT)-like permease